MRRLALLVILIAACVPDLGTRESLIQETTILAVRGEPPEVKPGESAHFDVLVATPNGPVAAPLARWAYCNSAKLLTENGGVSAACLRDAGVTKISDGPSTIDTAIPMNACNIFGPDVLAADVRPRDPDVTGGYYQPLRVIVEDKIAFGLERVGCGAPVAAENVVFEYAAKYRANRNPTLDPIALDSVLRGTKTSLRASWPEPETFVSYDLLSQTLLTHRESMRVSWFATAGTFDADRTGRAEEETALFTENGWTAPTETQLVHFYVVLRDPRGGVAFTTWDTTVR